MSDELKKALLENNIQILGVYDGKFVLLHTTIPIGNIPLVFKELFSREIPVGSIFIIKVDVGEDKIDIRRSVFVCCNASQSLINKKMIKNNLYWYDITENNQVIVPNEAIL